MRQDSLYFSLPPLPPGGALAPGPAAGATAPSSVARPSFLLVWPRNMRVWLNSPSLWPTMSSVTNTSRNARPLWTWKVWPTNSGTMVHARAQVLIGCRRLVVLSRSTFRYRLSTTFGPFFSERDIGDQQSVSEFQLSVAAALATSQNPRVGPLVGMPGPAALGLGAGGTRGFASALGAALAAAH